MKKRSQREEQLAEYFQQFASRMLKFFSTRPLESLDWPDPAKVMPTCQAGMRCLRALIDHSGLTPELVVKKTGRPQEEIEAIMKNPERMYDSFMLWDLALEDHEDVLAKANATIQTLIDLDEMDLAAIHFLADLGHVHLFNIGALDAPDA